MTEDQLPPGKLTNKDVALYVATKIEDAREEIREEFRLEFAAQQGTLRGWIEEYINARIDGLRDSFKDSNKRFRLEMRTWLASAVIINAISPGTLTTVGAVAGTLVGSHLLSRYAHIFNR